MHTYGQPAAAENAAGQFPWPTRDQNPNAQHDALTSTGPIRNNPLPRFLQDQASRA